jgi:nucleotide-binding universal stress UspA family protein
MNTLLVATDFSPAATNALEFAAMLAGKTKASLRLLHVYMVPVTMNDMPVLMASAETLKQSSEAGLDRLKSELSLRHPELTISCDSRMGDIITEVEQIAKNETPLAIVIGTHGMSGFERAVFGSTAASIIRHANIPVIAVPATYHQLKIDSMLLATDLRHGIPVAKIKHWTNQFGAALHIVHIAESKDKEPDEEPAFAEQFPDQRVSYEVIYNQDIQKGIITAIKKTGADLLLIMPHQHNLLDRIFHRQHTEALISHAPIPVLSIPA